MRLTKDGTINDTDSVLDTLIIQLLMKRQKGLCYGCNESLTGFQVHHKRYGLDIGLDDLALLCSPCHGAERGYKQTTGKLRQHIGTPRY